MLIHIVDSHKITNISNLCFVMVLSDLWEIIYIYSTQWSLLSSNLKQQ